MLASYVCAYAPGVPGYSGPRPPAPRPGGIIGFVDGIQSGNIFGWACQKYVSKSIDVHLYVDNAAGRPGAKIVKAVRADRAAEPAVSRSCGTSFRAYRYSIRLSAHELKKYQGLKIYVHGIRVSGSGPNSLLSKSGHFSIPSVPVGTPVIGFVDNVHGGYVHGWACQKYISSSLNVHVYAGNSAGRPGAKFVKAAKASASSEQAVSRACGTSFSAYRYKIRFTAQELKKFHGLKVYVHGIRVFGSGPNSLLSKSGHFRIH